MGVPSSAITLMAGLNLDPAIATGQLASCGPEKAGMSQQQLRQELCLARKQV